MTNARIPIPRKRAAEVLVGLAGLVLLGRAIAAGQTIWGVVLGSLAAGALAYVGASTASDGEPPRLALARADGEPIDGDSVDYLWVADRAAAIDLAHELASIDDDTDEANAFTLIEVTRRDVERIEVLPGGACCPEHAAQVLDPAPAHELDPITPVVVLAPERATVEAWVELADIDPRRVIWLTSLADRPKLLGQDLSGGLVVELAPWLIADRLGQGAYADLLAEVRRSSAKGTPAAWHVGDLIEDRLAPDAYRALRGVDRCELCAVDALAPLANENGTGCAYCGRPRGAPTPPRQLTPEDRWDVEAVIALGLVLATALIITVAGLVA